MPSSLSRSRHSTVSAIYRVSTTNVRIVRNSRGSSAPRHNDPGLAVALATAVIFVSYPLRFSQRAANARELASRKSVTAETKRTVGEMATTIHHHGTRSRHVASSSCRSTFARSHPRLPWFTESRAAELLTSFPLAAIRLAS